VKLVSSSSRKKKHRTAQNTTGGRDSNKYKTRADARDGNKYRSSADTRDSNKYKSNADANAAVRVNTADNKKLNKANNSKGSAKDPARKRKNGTRTAVIVLSVIIVAILASVIALGFYVRSLDTVFPNVWAEGIKLSGFTLAETTQALIDDGYENRADGISVSVVFPDETSFLVSGQEVGLSLNAAEAAAKVMAFGRDGSLINNVQTYINAFFNRTDLTDLCEASYNEGIVRERAIEHTSIFNETLLDNALEMDDDKITIVKGTGFELADADEVFDLAILILQRAIEENEHLTARYVPEAKTDNLIDLQIIFDSIHVDPVSAEYDPETMSATESSSGRTFDLLEAEDMLYRAEKGSTIVIPILILEPELSQDELNSMLFRDVIAERTTTIAGTSNRFHNISLASEHIDGTLLQPGGLFSFNEIVGIRTSARGFKEANAYIGGMLELDIGGGICQVSSTIYGALLYTHLEVVERRPHGMIVSYMKDKDGKTVHGQDATVAWGQIDFKFRNNMPLPIRVEVKIDGRELTVKLIGTKMDDTYIELEYVEISRTSPKVVYEDDDELYIGQTETLTGGMIGIVSETYRNHFTAAGELIERSLVTKDIYRVQNIRIKVGTLPPPPQPTHDPGDEYGESEV